MKLYALASAAALVLVTGSAFAQTTMTESTTVTAPTPPIMAPAPVNPPPYGTLSTTETQKSVDGNGDQYSSTKTTYGSQNGAYSQSSSSSTTQAPVPAVVTTKKTTTVTTNY